MLTLRLPPEIEDRLDALAKATGRSKSFYAREAITRHLDKLEGVLFAARHHEVDSLAQRSSAQITDGVEPTPHFDEDDEANVG